MKTPRLALLALALPALLLAPPVKAGPAPATASDLPKWSVVDESFRAWPTIYFTVGKDNRALRCRYSECNPETNKGQSNLYVMIEGARVQIDATIFEYHELGKWDPRRLTGQTHTKTPRVVKAHRQSYSTQLSNFKLDNTGGKLTVVQGSVKIPATTDIRTVYVSETGGVVSVAPPTKKASDVIKPDGSVPPVPPERRPTRTAKVRWCDPKTGTVHSIGKTEKPGAGWTPMGTAPGSSCKTIDGKPPAPEVTAPTPKISTKETPWLTKGQAAELAGEMAAWDKFEGDAPARASSLKDIVGRYRKEIVKNLQPSPNSAKYEAAAADPKATAATIEATLPAEVWGGPNSAVVGPFGDRLDIQLSKEEWTVLSSSATLAAALKAYKDGRKGVDGNASAGTQGEAKYSADMYDPIALHLVTMAARAAVGTVAKPPVTTPPGGQDGAAAPPLTADEMKLLTPKERQTYEKLLQNVKDKVPGAENALALESERLRKLIAAQDRAKNPYKVPTRESFATAPDWHKDIFCNPQTMGAAAAAADGATAGVDNTRDARRGLENSAATAGATTGGTTTSGGGLPDWAKGPCAIYLGSQTPAPGNGNGGTGGGGRINQGLGPDAVGKPVEDTVANSWFMRGQIQTFAKGALIGLVLGSLFGPIGLIAGPLIGGALFYGMQKYDAVKADKKEKNTPE